MSKIHFDEDSGCVHVEFSPQEMREIGLAAVERHKSQREANRFDWKAKKDGDGVENDLVGLLGEVAVRDACGYRAHDHISVLSIPEWDAMRRERCITDVGGIEVRSVPREPNDGRLNGGRTSLIVKHDKDRGKQDVAFVLAIITVLDREPLKLDRRVSLVGWAYGFEAMDKKYWRGQEENADRANYFMPMGDLRPIRTLYGSGPAGGERPKTRFELDAEMNENLDFSAFDE